MRTTIGAIPALAVGLIALSGLHGCGGGAGGGQPDASKASSASISDAGKGTSSGSTSSGSTSSGSTSSGSTSSGSTSSGSTSSGSTSSGSTSSGSTSSGSTSSGSTSSGSTSTTTAPSSTDTTEWPPAPQASPATACATRLTGKHATYDVGPGKTYTELTSVPWLSMQAGDVVNIHYRADPYRSNFGLRAQGTIDAPVVINGVTSTDCLRPVISGDGAVTATDAKKAGFGKDIEGSGLIQIFKGPNDDLATFTPRYITIQNLKLTGAKYGKSYQNQAGATVTYGYSASAIYAVRVHNLTVENCEITGNGIGIFTNSKGASSDDYSANIIVRRNRIYDNGNAGRDTEHNLYVQAKRALYEGNYIGQAYNGSSLKDRSSGTVIRYNKILASARAIDLVETEEGLGLDVSYANVQKDPLYPYAWVYGNIIINDSTLPYGFAGRMVHWGHDNTYAKSRPGTLFFYQNTLSNRVPQSSSWWVAPFQMGQDATAQATTKIEAASNIFWQQSNSEWRFLADAAGTLQFTGVNYVPTGWVPAESSLAKVLTVAGGLIVGLAPKLDAAFVPQADSLAINQTLVGPSTTPTGAKGANLTVVHQYKEGVGIVARPASATAPKGALGAMQGP